MKAPENNQEKFPSIPEQQAEAQRAMAASNLHVARFEAQQAHAGIELAQARVDAADERLASLIAHIAADPRLVQILPTSEVAA